MGSCIVLCPEITCLFCIYYSGDVNNGRGMEGAVNNAYEGLEGSANFHLLM